MEVSLMKSLLILAVLRHVLLEQGNALLLYLHKEVPISCQHPTAYLNTIDFSMVEVSPGM